MRSEQLLPAESGYEEKAGVEPAFSFVPRASSKQQVLRNNRDFRLQAMRYSLTTSALTFFPSIRSLPTLTGSLNRIGPALPGLK